MATEPLQEIRRCSKCGEDKPAENFELQRRQCKSCRTALKRQRRQRHETPEQRENRLIKAREYGRRNAERLRQSAKAYYRENIEASAEYRREYYRANKEIVKARAAKWRIENLGRKREVNRAWNEKNREKANQSFRKSKRKRRHEPGVRASESVSAQIRASMRGAKDGRPWERLLGYTRKDLVAHLERQFLPGMSWENYGDWHVDHILPVASFNFDSADHPDFRACWALTNLRPLWAADNIAKSDKRTLLI